jgi:hypothetical protein
MIGFTEDRSLRQKTINLVYILLLALIFSFIPSEFIDSVQTSEESMVLLCETVEEQNNKYALMILDYIKDDKILFDDLKYSILAINDRTSKAIQHLEKLKLSLVRDRGYNRHGFLKDGKRERTTNKVMIHEHAADSLFASLDQYKRHMAELLPAGEIAVLDSILPLKEYQRTSDGRFIKSDEFYFFRTPLSAAVLNISQFRARIERIRHYTTLKLIRVNLESKENNLPSPVLDFLEEQTSKNYPLEYLKNGNKEKYRVDPTETDYISDFFDKQEKKVQNRIQSLSENPQLLFVETKKDSIYTIWNPIRFKVLFDRSATSEVEVWVIHVNGENPIKYTMKRPGTFLFVPPTAGLYRFSFRSPFEVHTKDIHVLDAEPALQNNNMGVLYVGMDNLLNIDSKNYEDTEGLVTKISNGKILKKGSRFYAQVQKKEIVEVEVFARMPYGFVQVAKKKFAVRDLLPPFGTINYYKSGETIPLAELPKLRNIDVKNAEYLIDDQFKIKSFEFTIIYNFHTAILQPIKHQGSALNPAALGALKRVKPGDILLFDKIEVYSPSRRNTSIAPITLTVSY